MPSTPMPLGPDKKIQEMAGKHKGLREIPDSGLIFGREFQTSDRNSLPRLSFLIWKRSGNCGDRAGSGKVVRYSWVRDCLEAHRQSLLSVRKSCRGPKGTEDRAG